MRPQTTLALLLGLLAAKIWAPAPAAAQVCGNGVQEAGEQCDTGPANGTTECGCSLACDFPFSGNPCGSQSDTLCDDPDTCDGAGVCVPNHAPAYACGDEAQGDCFATDYCGGGVCVDSGFEPVGQGCGDESDTQCDNPDTCTAGGICAANPDPICGPIIPALPPLGAVLLAAALGGVTAFRLRRVS